ARDAGDGIVGALARRAACAISHADEPRVERRERLDRLPQRGFHLLRLGRKELERNVDIACHVCKQRRSPLIERPRISRRAGNQSHAAFTLLIDSPTLRASHNFTVSVPPSSVSVLTGARPAASNQPSICSSEKPSRTWPSRLRS